MTGFGLLHPWALLLLATVPALAWLFRWAEHKRAADVQRFLPSLPYSTRAGRLHYTSLVALSLMALAVAQPAWQDNKATPARTGPDVVFLLDVSRSMLAKETAGSRLEQAKTAIREVIARGGEGRFGLVVFAGNASIECPLTNDYSFLRDQLKAASRESVTAGGTQIAEAILLAARSAFDDASRNTRELVLISDGGEGDPNAATAMAELAQRGIRLVVVGVGDEKQAKVVPTSENDPTPLQYQGKVVTTRLDREALRKICDAGSHCAYTTIPDDTIARTILDSRSLFARAGQGTAPMIATILWLAAAALLVWESLAERAAS